MVEFCPKCGSLLVPVKKNNKIFLVCPKCGYEKEVKKSKNNSYRKTFKISEDKKTKTAILEENTKINKEEKVREKELLKEYYEIFLETMEENEED